MRKAQASGTAIGTAAVRAIESEKPADELHETAAGEEEKYPDG